MNERMKAVVNEICACKPSAVATKDNLFNELAALMREFRHAPSDPEWDKQMAWLMQAEEKNRQELLALAEVRGIELPPGHVSRDRLIRLLRRHVTADQLADLLQQRRGVE